jgi:transposase
MLPKTKAVKKIPETEAIFEQVEKINKEADESPNTLRISLDAKVAVKVGEFDRGGKTRTPTMSLDHDFSPEATLIPYGIFLPEYNELFLFFVSSKLTADCMVDILESWWETVKYRFAHIQKLVINQDNGPENHSRRTQFMKRIVDFSISSQLTLQLAYYPPYHSKYNPIERCFGWLEQHWNGTQLKDMETMLKWAQSMTWKGIYPIVKLIQKSYSKGISLTKMAMRRIEKRLERNPDLPKWDILIRPAYG